LVVRVIHYYYGGFLVSCADYDGRIRSKIGDNSSFCSGEVVMRLERVSEAKVINLFGEEGKKIQFSRVVERKRVITRGRKEGICGD